MMTGISTACFYPQYPEDALRLIAAEQPDCVEVFVNARCELEPNYLRELRKIADDAGVRIASVHPYTSGMEPMYFFSHYDRRYQEGLELYKHFYQAANLLGADILVFHGALRVAKIPSDMYFERFAPLWEDARRNGVDFCQENVERCTSHTPEFFRAMAKAMPDVGYVFDVKQAVRAGVDVYEFADAMGRRVRHIHISDHNATHDCLPPGTGVLHSDKLVSTIAQNGFDGAVVVEIYRHNFAQNVEIFASYRDLSTKLSTVKTGG